MRVTLLASILTPISLLATACGGGGGGGSGGSSSTTGSGGGIGTTTSSTSTTASATTTGGGGGPPCGAFPTEGVYATFDVVGETYYASITNPTGVDQAIALWKGTATASIPNGKTVCTPAPWNCPWSFHQDPATIGFADMTIEVCDGTPSYVDAHCADFTNAYCPWSAKLVELRDCRTDPACPVVAK